MIDLRLIHHSYATDESFLVTSGPFAGSDHCHRRERSPVNMFIDTYVCPRIKRGTDEMSTMDSRADVTPRILITNSNIYIYRTNVVVAYVNVGRVSPFPCWVVGGRQKKSRMANYADWNTLDRMPRIRFRDNDLSIFFTELRFESYFHRSIFNPSWIL